MLLDLSLPDVHGGKVAARLREEPELRRTLIVAVTGLGQDQARRWVREQDFDARLVKPVDYGELAALLSESGREPS